MDAEVLRIERYAGGIEVWTVDRPAARNAVDPVLAGALARAVGHARDSLALRAVVLTGAGDAAFISGADLKFLRDAALDARADHDRTMTVVLEALAQLPVPVIGALNGPVIGGGVEVALACDVRIAEAHCSVTVKHALMGISPGWGGFRRLVATVGKGAAAKLLLTATTMPADEALRVGLFDELTEKGAALPRALELARAIALTSPSAIAETKALLNRGYGCGFTLEDEQAMFIARTVAGDHREALGAFFEKRTAEFKPRGEG